MIERINSEKMINREQDNAVFNSTLLLNGESASENIIERVIDFPDIKRIIIFGEPGANKTTILLQLASELIKHDSSIEPNYIFYDNALAQVKQRLGLANLTTRAQYDLVSNIISNEMHDGFPEESKDESSRPIQFVELVGISAKNRGTSTLKEAAERVKDQGPMTQDTLFIGVAADVRSLKDAGKMRKAVTELENPAEVFDLLDSFNTHVVDYPKDIPLQEVGEKIIEFFSRMASEARIEMVHREVMAQAKLSTAEDDDRLFKILKLPALPYPIETIEAKNGYLLNAAFLQEYLQRLGLKPDMYDLSFKLKDKGLVVFSPYNPKIPKNIDLSKALKSENR